VSLSMRTPQMRWCGSISKFKPRTNT